jgi:hypothetical protein
VVEGRGGGKFLHVLLLKDPLESFEGGQQLHLWLSLVNLLGYLGSASIVSAAGIPVQTLFPESSYLSVGVEVEVPDQIALGYGPGGVMPGRSRKAWYMYLA